MQRYNICLCNNRLNLSTGYFLSLVHLFSSTKAFKHTRMKTQLLQKNFTELKKLLCHQQFT